MLIISILQRGGVENENDFYESLIISLLTLHVIIFIFARLLSIKMKPKTVDQCHFEECK